MKNDTESGLGTRKRRPLADPATVTRSLTRDEAAAYISKKWFPCSPKTLAKLAVVGGGPAFRHAGRMPLHERLDLDTWAEAKLGPKVHSTSELREVA